MCVCVLMPRICERSGCVARAQAAHDLPFTLRRLPRRADASPPASLDGGIKDVGHGGNQDVSVCVLASEGGGEMLPRRAASGRPGKAEGGRFICLPFCVRAPGFFWAQTRALDFPRVSKGLSAVSGVPPQSWALAVFLGFLKMESTNFFQTYCL